MLALLGFIGKVVMHGGQGTKRVQQDVTQGYDYNSRYTFAPVVYSSS